MIANHIRKLRTARGMSQYVLADMVRTSQQQIARIETKGQDPGIVQGLAIAAALGVAPDEVFPAVKAAVKHAQAAGR